MKHIVLIDDDKDFLEVLTYVLRDNGYKVTPYRSAVGLLPKIAGHSPDAVVVDNTMPELDGAKFTRQLKNNKETKRLPVIMMSAFRHSALMAKSAGADYFLPKPFDIKTLITALNLFTNR